MLTQADWERIWAAFHAASDLPHEQRDSFLRSTLPERDLSQKALELLAELEEGPFIGESGESSPEWRFAGTRLGRFEVQEPIGRGGVGEVYRALDTELDRLVAVKCIAGRRLGSAATEANFIQEARLASALNHPGIVTIHEVIRTADTVAIVMELATGSTLRKFCKAPQSEKQISHWGRQVADALATSHAAGLVHRDIKPENLVLRPDGLVKILDFGLARRHTERSEPKEFEINGTLRYMSPEQARGEEAGPPSDVFSLGVVLYEMAAGVHPFAGGADMGNSTMTVAQTIAQITAPALSSRNPKLSVPFRRLIDRMISPRASDRPTAAEVATLLGRAGTTPAGNWRPYLLACAAAAAFAMVVFLRQPQAAPAAPLQIVPFTTYQGAASQPSFSPDGRKIAFAWTGPEGSNRDIYYQVIGESRPHRLTTDVAEDLNPVFSRDGNWIAFFRQTPSDPSPRVMVIPAEGGQERQVGRISPLFGYRGMDWWPDGKGLFIRDALTDPSQASIIRLSFEDGTKKQFSFPPDSEADGRPTVSPDGTRVAFLRYQTDGTEICWKATTGGDVHCPARANAMAGLAWHRSGKAVYYSDGKALWRVELTRLGKGASVKLADGIFSDLAADRTGNYLAFSRGLSDSNLWKVERNKKPERVVASSGEDSDPAWSPDGRHIVMRSNRSGAYELYVYNSDGSGERQVTRFGAHLASPRWSPDGASIAFDGNRAPADPLIRHHNIYVVPSAGGDFRRITDDRFNYEMPSWSPDGNWIYFQRSSDPPETRKAPIGGGASVYVGESMRDMVESADGRYFYFTSSRGPGIWRRPASGGAAQVLPGTEGVQMYRYWDLTRYGIYFVDTLPKATLRFFDFRNAHVESVASLPQALFYGPRALAASPNSSSIIYTLQDVMLGDIMLISGFDS